MFERPRGRRPGAAVSRWHPSRRPVGYLPAQQTTPDHENGRMAEPGLLAILPVRTVHCLQSPPGWSWTKNVNLLLGVPGSPGLRTGEDVNVPCYASKDKSNPQIRQCHESSYSYSASCSPRMAQAYWCWCVGQNVIRGAPRGLLAKPRAPEPYPPGRGASRRFCTWWVCKKCSSSWFRRRHSPTDTACAEVCTRHRDQRRHLAYALR
jgi:hypothetical protein